jgi:hypothetical protein
MDATCVSIPGSTGTDWRLHISLDVGSMCIDGVEVTDQHSGETFAHFPSRPGDIRIGDRGYAFAKSIGPVLAEGGWVVVRITWQNLPLESAEGQRIDVPQLAQQLTSTLAEWEVYLPTEQGRFQMRLALAALPQEAADKARCRIRKIYRKKGKTPDKRTLLTAGFIMVITNLPMAPWSTLEVLKLYRTRWQIELLFKRLKSILRLDHLRAFDSDLAQVYLLAKILAALLSEQFIQKIKLRYPAWFSSTRCPISFWRLTALSFDWLVQTVRGHITHAMILHALPLLARFLCDPPRKRPSQLAQLSFLLSNLSSAL